MKTGLIIGAVVLVLGVVAYFAFFRKSTGLPQAPNPLSNSGYAPPVRSAARPQPAGSLTPTQNIENQAVNLGFKVAGDAITNWLDSDS